MLTVCCVKRAQFIDTGGSHIYANGPNGKGCNRVQYDNEERTKLHPYTGAYTLHGGKIGWDRRNWTLAARTTNSLTFSHIDAGDENFPGNVSVKVSYMKARHLSDIKREDAGGIHFVPRCQI